MSAAILLAALFWVGVLVGAWLSRLAHARRGGRVSIRSWVRTVPEPRDYDEAFARQRELRSGR